MHLDSAKQFKDALVKFTIQKRKEIKLVRNTMKEVRAKFVKSNYQLYIFASKESETKGLIVKTYMPDHSCPEDLKLDMSLTKVKRSKERMLAKLQGDAKKEFALL